MRKLAVLITALAGLGAVTSIAFGGNPATAPNGSFIDLDVNVSPPKVSTAARPRGSTIDFHSFTGNRVNNSMPTSTSDIKVGFARGFVLNGASFPTCKVETTPGVASKCTTKSQIGSGTAEGATTDASGKTTFTPVTLKGYNGSKIGGKPSVIFLGQIGGNTVAELDFTLSQTSSGPVLDDYVPPGTPPGPISITQFNFKTNDLTVTKTVGGKRTVVHYVTNPTSCPKAGWKFTQRNTSANGTLVATSFAPCTR